MAFIQLRISEEDKAVLEAVSRVRGISLSDYIRQSALDAARAMPPAEIDLLRHMLRQILHPFLAATPPLASGEVFDRATGEREESGALLER